MSYTTLEQKLSDTLTQLGQVTTSAEEAAALKMLTETVMLLGPGGSQAIQAQIAAQLVVIAANIGGLAANIGGLATRGDQATSQTILSGILSALGSLGTHTDAVSTQTILSGILSGLAPLSTGATAALQGTGNASLAGISTSVANLATLLTATQGQAANVASLLGRYSAGTSTLTISPVVTTTSQKIVSANANRKGLYIYNNSANSIYLAFGSASNSNTNMTLILATFAQFIMPTPIYTGDIYGIRNAGTGTCLVTELT